MPVELPVEQPAVPQLADGTGVRIQSAKRLRIATRFETVEQLIASLHRFCEDSAIFLPNVRRSVGAVTEFSFDLKDGRSVLAGIGAVVEEFTTTQNRFARAGIVIALQQLGGDSAAVFERVLAARGAGRKDAGAARTSAPIVERAGAPLRASDDGLKAEGPAPAAAEIRIPSPADRTNRAKTVIGLAAISKPPATCSVKIPAIVAPLAKKLDAPPVKQPVKQPAKRGAPLASIPRAGKLSGPAAAARGPQRAPAPEPTPSASPLQREAPIVDATPAPRLEAVPVPIPAPSLDALPEPSLDALPEPSLDVLPEPSLDAIPEPLPVEDCDTIRDVIPYALHQELGLASPVETPDAPEVVAAAPISVEQALLAAEVIPVEQAILVEQAIPVEQEILEQAFPVEPALPVATATAMAFAPTRPPTQGDVAAAPSTPRPTHRWRWTAAVGVTAMLFVASTVVTVLAGETSLSRTAPAHPVTSPANEVSPLKAAMDVRSSDPVASQAHEPDREPPAREASPDAAAPVVETPAAADPGVESPDAAAPGVESPDAAAPGVETPDAADPTAVATPPASKHAAPSRAPITKSAKAKAPPRRRPARRARAKRHVACSDLDCL